MGTRGGTHTTHPTPSATPKLILLEILVKFYSIFLLENRVKNRVILGNQEYLEIRSNYFCYIGLRVGLHID